MIESISQSNMSELPVDCEPTEFPELSDRDCACMVLPDLDYDSQLTAIRNLLRRHTDFERESSDEIKKIEEYAHQCRGIRNEHAVNERIDRLHASVYQDAAHSMAAVGMLAPLIESLFFQAFRGMQPYFSCPGDPLCNHKRWQQSSEDR